MKLNTLDLVSLGRRLEKMNETPEDYDGPEIVVTSLGYCNLHLDGDVTYHGRVLCNLEGNNYHRSSKKDA